VSLAPFDSAKLRSRSSGRVPRGLGALWLPCPAQHPRRSGVCSPGWNSGARSLLAARGCKGGPAAGRRCCPSRGTRLCGYFAAISGYSRISP